MTKHCDACCGGNNMLDDIKEARESVQLEIFSIVGRLKYLEPDCGISKSAGYTRWILSKVIAHAAAAMKTLAGRDWERLKEECSEVVTEAGVYEQPIGPSGDASVIQCLPCHHGDARIAELEESNQEWRSDFKALEKDRDAILERSEKHRMSCIELNRQLVRMERRLEEKHG